MKKNIVIVALSVFAGLLIVLFAAEGFAIGFGRDQVIHVLNGKTVAEYQGVMDNLTTANGKIGDLQNQVGNLNGQIGDLKGQKGDLQSKIETLNSTIAGLQGQIGSWNALVCSHTWAEFATPNELTFWSDLPNGIFSSMGFELYATQWKPAVVDSSKPYTTLILDVKANIVWDVTDHCIIMKESVSGPSD
jgi:uncharacterized protein YukE